MSLQVPRTLAVTFESSVHCAHVLQRLNEQRQRHVLCDVTVLVQDKHFHAHCSVLVSCSDYFHSRFIDVANQSAIIALPDEVTVEGFEPLLEFAYTSKLTFTKENMEAIYRSAGLLGFHNLETKWFGLLFQKFSNGSKTAQEVERKKCCQAVNVDLNPYIDTNPSESEESHGSEPPSGIMPIDFSSQCPQNTQGQTNRGEEHFSLDNSGPQMSPPLSLGLTDTDVCPILAMQCPNNNKTNTSSQFCARHILTIDNLCDQRDLNLVDCALPCDLSSSACVSPPALMQQGNHAQATGINVDQPVEALLAETSCELSGSCPLNTTGAEHGCELLEKQEASLEGCRSVDEAEPTLSDHSHEEGFGNRSRDEREVAEHLAMGFWMDLYPPQTQPLPVDPIDQNGQSKASDFHWLKQLDLSSSTGDCPFLRGLGSGEEPPSEMESQSLSQKSPYLSSSNSGEESDLDTDGDAEANRKRAEEVQLPFPVERISALSRSAFQQLLRRQHLTPDQLDFVHDVRRRSKNRIAAQRCRKRKLDSIHTLECEIKKLRGDKERLIQEHKQLEQDMEEARQNLSGLFKSVSIESGPEQDHLQLLAKISSDGPISALLKPLSSLMPMGKEQDTQLPLDTVGCPLQGNPSGQMVDCVQSKTQCDPEEEPSLNPSLDLDSNM